MGFVIPLKGTSYAIFYTIRANNYLIIHEIRVSHPTQICEKRTIPQCETPR